METASPVFHFPTEIALPSNPLVEAWLEIRWQLQSGKFSDPMIDPGFPFALGVFYSNIKDEFGYKEPLPTSIAPEEMLPYAVRFRFRQRPDTWPVLQLGPGIATVNFTSPYTWEDFKAKSLYLRRHLTRAYIDADLIVQNLFLRYRNVIQLDYTSSDFLDFLENKLNTSLRPPKYIPGKLAKSSWPTGVNTSLTYDLIQPLGKGIIRFATGFQKLEDQKKPVIIFELEVQSLNENNTYWSSDDVFDTWLTSAHATIHEWFFALIDGSLRKEYEEKVR